MNNRTVIAFDVGQTLDIADGPIKTQYVKDLYDADYIVGICGNWKHYIGSVSEWERTVSFVGHMYGYITKDIMLKQLKDAISADRYILVGNDPSIRGRSDDINLARISGWEFIKEDNFRIEDFI